MADPGDQDRLEGWVDRLNEGEKVDSDEAQDEAEAAALRWLEVLNVPGNARGSDAERLVGTHIGPYLLLACIGEGGQGRVYEGVHDSLERKVALKILPDQFALTPKQIARFQREARAAASLEHPGIVGIYEIGEHEGIYYYAMEFVDGAPLSSFIKAQKKPDAVREPSVKELDPSTVGGYYRWSAAVILDCAEALGHAHVHGVIHRDVKPSNVLVGCDGRARLSDFGLARIEADPTITRTGIRFGTLSYMSPEHVSGVNLDPRSDVFSLGVTLYEVVTLRRPFGGTTEGEILYQISHEEPDRPRKVQSAVDRDLEAIILKAMEKDPSLRYPNGDAMAADLRRYLAHEPVEARPWTIPTGIQKWIRRNPRGALAIAVVVFTVLLAGVWFEKFQRQSRELETIRLEERRLQAADAIREGVLHMARGANAAARVQLNNAIRLEPGKVEAELLLALAEADSGQPDLRSRALERTDRLLAQKPDLAGAHFLRSKLLLESGEAMEAKRSQVLAQGLASRLPVEVYLRAAVARDEGRAEEALELFNEAVERAPTAIEYLFSRQGCFLELGRDQRAYGDASVITHAAAGEPWAHLNLGNVSLILGQLEEALEAYDAALELDPLDKTARLQRSVGLTLAGRGDSGEAELQDVLRGFSEDPMAWATAALAQLRTEHPRARESAEKAYGLAEDHPYCQRVLADCRLVEGELAEARELYERARRDPVSRPAASYGLALVHLREGDVEAAALAFDDAVRPLGVPIEEWIPGFFRVRTPAADGEKETLLPRCREVVRLGNGENQAALATLARILVDLGREEKARSVVGEGKSLEGTNPFLRTAVRLFKRELLARAD